MKPESARFVEQAALVLARADIMLTVSLNEDAARAAYLASFHVAQAYIFERTDKTPKSHNGVQVEFFRLSKDDARVDAALRRFLSQAYEFKSVADYATGPDAVTSASDARDAVATAKRFVAHFAQLVPLPGSAPVRGSRSHAVKRGPLRVAVRRLSTPALSLSFIHALCSTPAAGVLASMRRDAPRPDRIRTARRGGRVKSAACLLARRERSHAQKAGLCCRFSSMASTHLLMRPSTVAPGLTCFLALPHGENS